MSTVAHLIGLVLRGMIRAYQLVISPVLPSHCRYAPSCSAYALEAVRRFGPLHGAAMAIGRILRCHPWGGDGFDPVPAPAERRRRRRHGSAAT